MTPNRSTSYLGSDDAALEPFEKRAAGSAFHRRVDILLDPLDEILRPQADNVRLFRTLDHGLIASVGGSVAFGRSPRMAESLLTLRPWRCTDGNESWA